MRAEAPTWYDEVSRSTPADAAVSRAASQERLKREIAAFVRRVSISHGLVLFFDDVHWSDLSTVDLVSYLASHFETTRLLIVATYRPDELRLSDHAFLRVKLDLQSRGLCKEFPLSFLNAEDIGAYLQLECPKHRFPDTLCELLHVRTEGNPLFVVDLVRYLRERGVITETEGVWTLSRSLSDIETDLPESIRSMIQRKIDRLDESDRRLLQAASVQGYDFNTATVSQALRLEPENVEDELQRLEEVHGLVRLLGEAQLPDGTFTVRYRFVHVLYQNALYERLTPTRRASWSAKVAGALERLHGERRSDIAAELAFLFEVARDFPRAADFYRVAADNTARIFAYKETILLARRGLALVNALSSTPETARKQMEQELQLQSALGVSLLATKGFGAEEVERVYARATELCRQLGDTTQLFPVLWGLWWFHEVRAELKMAQELAAQLLTLSQHAHEATLRLQAHRAMGQTLYWRGEFSQAHAHFDQGIALYDPRQHHSNAFVYGQDPGVGLRNFSTLVLWHHGYPDQAAGRIQESVALAQELDHPFSEAFALSFAAWLQHYRRDASATQTQAEAAMTLCREQGFDFFLAQQTILLGWALAEQGHTERGLAQMRQGLASYEATGAIGEAPYLCALLAEASGKAGQARDGLLRLEEALTAAQKHELLVYEGELSRLKGELLLMQTEMPASERPTSTAAEAEACFRYALDLAQRQQAKSLELRASMSLARLWQQYNNGQEARRMLLPIYSWFTEGLDTADLREAKTLLGA